MTTTTAEEALAARMARPQRHRLLQGYPPVPLMRPAAPRGPEGNARTADEHEHALVPGLAGRRVDAGLLRRRQREPHADRRPHALTPRGMFFSVAVVGLVIAEHRRHARGATTVDLARRAYDFTG